MDETAKISVMVGIQSPRRLHWFTPQALNGREPTVFCLIRNAQGYYVPTGPYCCISFRVPPRRSSRKATATPT
jgi:hypothetical protein